MMLENNKYKISVITAVYNAESCIQNLIESLRAQQDKAFEWVVVDGASTDRTLEILNEVKDLNIKIISEPDFGIYDALNKGVKACSGEYYLVAGADDVFFENAINDYKCAIEEGYGMISAPILKNGVEFKPARGPSWRFASDAYISNHSLGVLIRKELHLKFGFYSKKFPIAADQLFVKECAQNGVKIKIIKNLVGNFALVGTSSIDEIGACMEILRVQLLTEKRKYLVFALYFTRIIKRLIKY